MLPSFGWIPCLTPWIALQVGHCKLPSWEYKNFFWKIEVKQQTTESCWSTCIKCCLLIVTSCDVLKHNNNIKLPVYAMITNNCCHLEIFISLTALQNLSFNWTPVGSSSFVFALGSFVNFVHCFLTNPKILVMVKKIMLAYNRTLPVTRSLVYCDKKKKKKH